MVCEAETGPQEVAAETVYVPGAVTEMEGVVSPFGVQVFPDA